MTWFITGNANIGPDHFLGTISNQPLIIKTNQLADNSEKMRINPDGNVGIGKAPSTSYKLDVAGTFNATDIHKNGSSVVSSQWIDVSGGINYATGKVGIGKTPGAYKLDVEGVINATDIHMNGSPLSVLQWEDVAGGITYGGGAVGIAKAPSRSYKLDVAGTINATEFRKNGAPFEVSQWTDVSGGTTYDRGNVGIGKAPSTQHKLDVKGPVNATEFRKNGTPFEVSQWTDVSGGISYSAEGTPPANEETQYHLQADGLRIETNIIWPTVLHFQSGKPELVDRGGLWGVRLEDGELQFISNRVESGNFSSWKTVLTLSDRWDTNGELVHIGAPTTIGWPGGSNNLTVYGNAYKPGGGSWSASSDVRLKKSVGPLKDALDKLLQLRGVSFEWKEPEKQGNLTGPQMGLIAQEVEEVFPEWIDSHPSGYKILTVRGFEALAVEALKEIKAENEALRSRIEALERI